MAGQYAKAPLEQHQFARNGKLPDAYLAAELADHINHASRYRLKEVARFSADIMSFGDTAGNFSGERTRWRFAFHSSPYSSVLLARGWLAPCSTTNATGPYVRVRIQDGTPTTVGDVQLAYGASSSDGGEPHTFLALTDYMMSSPGEIATLPANTALYGTVSDFDSARCVGISIYEGSLLTALPGPCDEGLAIGRPIFDKDRQDAITAARAMWKQGAAKLFTWSVNRDAVARTRSSSTAINVIDNSSTSVSAATPGFTLDLRYKSTVRRGTVPVTIKAYGSIPAGAGAAVLVDSGGVPVATVTINSATPGWFSTTCNLPATLAKYDLHYKGDGTNTVTLQAVSAYQYEA